MQITVALALAQGAWAVSEQVSPSTANEKKFTDSYHQ